MKFKVEIMFEPDEDMTENEVQEMVQENCLEYSDEFPGNIYIKKVKKC